jgi:inorganic pyrophosphatase
VLSESENTGSIIKVLPIAVLKLIDDGEMDYKIIAIPVDKNKQIIDSVTYLEFSKNFPEIKQIIVLCFLN